MKNRILDCQVLHRSGKRYSWCLDTVMKPPKYLQTLAVQASQISDNLKRKLCLPGPCCSKDMHIKAIRGALEGNILP